MLIAPLSILEPRGAEARMLDFSSLKIFGILFSSWLRRWLRLTILIVTVGGKYFGFSRD